MYPRSCSCITQSLTSGHGFSYSPSATFTPPRMEISSAPKTNQTPWMSSPSDVLPHPTPYLYTTQETSSFRNPSCIISTPTASPAPSILISSMMGVVLLPCQRWRSVARQSLPSRYSCYPERSIRPYNSQYPSRPIPTSQTTSIPHSV